jgi:hypothetical protein
VLFVHAGHRYVACRCPRECRLTFAIVVPCARVHQSQHRGHAVVPG